MVGGWDYGRFPVYCSLQINFVIVGPKCPIKCASYDLHICFCSQILSCKSRTCKRKRSARCKGYKCILLPSHSHQFPVAEPILTFVLLVELEPPRNPIMVKTRIILIKPNMTNPNWSCLILFNFAIFRPRHHKSKT